MTGEASVTRQCQAPTCGAWATRNGIYCEQHFLMRPICEVPSCREPADDGWPLCGEHLDQRRRFCADRNCWSERTFEGSRLSVYCAAHLEQRDFRKDPSRCLHRLQGGHRCANPAKFDHDHRCGQHTNDPIQRIRRRARLPRNNASPPDINHLGVVPVRPQELLKLTVREYLQLEMVLESLEVPG